MNQTMKSVSNLQNRRLAKKKVQTKSKSSYQPRFNPISKSIVSSLRHQLQITCGHKDLHIQGSQLNRLRVVSSNIHSSLGSHVSERQIQNLCASTVFCIGRRTAQILLAINKPKEKIIDKVFNF